MYVLVIGYLAKAGQLIQQLVPCVSQVVGTLYAAGLYGYDILVERPDLLAVVVYLVYLSLYLLIDIVLIFRDTGIHRLCPLEEGGSLAHQQALVGGIRRVLLQLLHRSRKLCKGVLESHALKLSEESLHLCDRIIMCGIVFGSSGLEAICLVKEIVAHCTDIGILHAQSYLLG